jgi:APA family basic amino acid/polyamine antiporter
MADPQVVAQQPTAQQPKVGFLRELGLLDSTMIVAGSMIGSGIFIVSAQMARETGAAGWVLVTWIVTGLLTITGALCYGELAARMPHVGGQYAYLRQLYSPLVGFLYGWTFFLVIQTGTIAAVAIGFARFLGVLAPAVSKDNYLIAPVALSEGYALSLNTQQLVAILMMVLLTFINVGGLRLGRWIQNVFTTTKTLALIALIGVGLVMGFDADVVRANFEAPFAPVDPATLSSGLGAPPISAALGLMGLLIALGVAQVGSLFSSDAWNNLTFTAGEVKDPRRTIPRALALGTGLVILLYVLANVAYLVTLPLSAIKAAPDDRVATATLNAIFGAAGASIMAIFIVISTFGCNNGLVLAGARVYYAMARDGLFFRPVGSLNHKRVPGVALWLQCAWACLLVLPRTVTTTPAAISGGAPTVAYGNLYGQLLDYVIFAVLIFYVLTVAGVFRLRGRAADAAGALRAASATGAATSAGGDGGARHPLAALLSIGIAVAIMGSLIFYKTETTWPGLLIVLTGIPVFLVWRRTATPMAAEAAPE